MMMTSQTGNGVLKKRKNREKGFTLVEVILSVVILSVGLIAINQTLLRSLSILTYLQTRSHSNTETQNKIWEIQNAAWHQSKAPLRKEEGVLLSSRKAFNYHIQSVGVSGSKFLYEIRMAVRWVELGKELGLLRTFYVRLPPLQKS